MRRCEYCEKPLPDSMRSSAVYCDGVCRRGAWAERTGYRGETPAQGAASRGNGRERFVDPFPRPARTARSGLQVSYRKALKAAVQAIDRAAVHRVLGEPFRPDEVAEAVMREALSPAQRARLEARS